MRVVIADDSALIRSGVRLLLSEAGMEGVGEAADAPSLLALVARTDPDVAVVDIRMPPGEGDDGIRAATRIRQEHPRTAVLVLSQYTESAYALRLVEQSPAGVGYLLKDRITGAGVLADALRRVVAGECLVDSTIVTRLLANARRRDPLGALTERELEVLALMAEGRSNGAICTVLCLSPKTVETHISRVFGKLGLVAADAGHRRVQAVLTYLRQGTP